MHEPHVPHPRAATGVGTGLAAFIIWGVFPLYLKPLHAVPPLEVIAHRVLWSCVFVLAVLALRGELGTLRATLAHRGNLWRLALTATLVSLNWFIYVWAVAHGRVLETSLGYFINPLLNVLLGVIVLAERLNRRQWAAVAVAAAAVAYLTVVAGGLPWIALGLAFSFGLYGLARKLIRVEALAGLAAETVLLLPLALIYLVTAALRGGGAFGHAGAGIDALLVGSGLATAVPLFLFAYAARLIPYSTVGVLQYIAPSLQFACGIWFFHESFERSRALGFALIWIALVIYAADGLWRARAILGR